MPNNRWWCRVQRPSINWQPSKLAPSTSDSAPSSIESMESIALQCISGCLSFRPNSVRQFVGNSLQWSRCTRSRCRNMSRISIAKSIFWLCERICGPIWARWRKPPRPLQRNSLQCDAYDGIMCAHISPVAKERKKQTIRACQFRGFHIWCGALNPRVHLPVRNCSVCKLTPSKRWQTLLTPNPMLWRHRAYLKFQFREMLSANEWLSLHRWGNGKEKSSSQLGEMDRCDGVLTWLDAHFYVLWTDWIRWRHFLRPFWPAGSCIWKAEGNTFVNTAKWRKKKTIFAVLCIQFNCFRHFSMCFRASTYFRTKFFYVQPSTFKFRLRSGRQIKHLFCMLFCVKFRCESADLMQHIFVEIYRTLRFVWIPFGLLRDNFRLVQSHHIPCGHIHLLHSFRLETIWKWLDEAQTAWWNGIFLFSSNFNFISKFMLIKRNMWSNVVSREMPDKRKKNETLCNMCIQFRFLCVLRAHSTWSRESVSFSFQHMAIQHSNLSCSRIKIDVR